MSTSCTTQSAKTRCPAWTRNLRPTAGSEGPRRKHESSQRNCILWRSYLQSEMISDPKILKSTSYFKSTCYWVKIHEGDSRRLLILDRINTCLDGTDDQTTGKKKNLRNHRSQKASRTSLKNWLHQKWELLYYYTRSRLRTSMISRNRGIIPWSLTSMTSWKLRTYLRSPNKDQRYQKK